LKAYFVNLMSQPGETTNFRASDHVDAMMRHARRPIVDVCVINTRSIRGKALTRYRAQAARPVEIDTERLQAMGLEILGADLLRKSGVSPEEKIRHDQDALGAVVMELAGRGRSTKMEKT
jgi:uncharacterized cofD-like protein